MMTKIHDPRVALAVASTVIAVIALLLREMTATVIFYKIQGAWPSNFHRFPASQLAIVTCILTWCVVLLWVYARRHPVAVLVPTSAIFIASLVLSAFCLYMLFDGLTEPMKGFFVVNFVHISGEGVDRTNAHQKYDEDAHGSYYNVWRTVFILCDACLLLSGLLLATICILVFVGVHHVHDDKREKALYASMHHRHT